jgi:CHAT domain-containing protein
MEEARYREVMQELDEVRLLLEQHPDPVRSAEFSRNLGLAYSEMGELDHARDNYLRCLRTATELKDAGMEMEALINIGYLYLSYGTPERGLACADSALAKAVRSGNLLVQRGANVLSAELRTRLEDYDGAMRHWQNALEIDEAREAPGCALIDSLGIGNIYALKGDCPRARGIYRQVLPRIREAGYCALEECLWFGFAHTFEKECPDSARFYYEMALKRMEEAGFQTSSAELGTGFQGNKRHYYEEVARFYADMAERTGDDGWLCDAFMTIERCKARGMLEMLHGAVEVRHSAEEEALLDSIYSLDPQAPGYAAELERLERRYRVMKEERIGSAAEKLEAKGKLAGLEDVCGALPGKTAIFTYALGDSVSLLWVADRDGYEMHRLPGRRELANETKLMVQAICRPGAGDEAFVARARSLYGILIEPGAARLDGVTDIVIIPDGCLFGIPFEALLAGGGGSSAGWEGMPFLFRSYNTVYAPSASCFLRLRKKKYTSDYDIDLLALGDPDYAGLDTGAMRPLRALPGTRTEVECIGCMFDEKERILLVGSSASEGALKKSISDNPSRVIHIAAHGLVDPVTPVASSIALGAEPGSGEDGYLHTLEILALPVDSRLVVLSACETAKGRIGRGEGVVGLSRAFLCAGASAVVSSLWSVPDESTALLMENFYSNMTGKEISAVKAMRLARESLLETEDYSHPFHWASFIATGTNRAPW